MAIFPYFLRDLGKSSYFSRDLGLDPPFTPAIVCSVDYRYIVYSQHTCGGNTKRAMKILRLNDEWTAPDELVKPVATVAGHLEAT